MSLDQLHASCKQHPELLNVPHDKITLYISLIRHLQARIARARPQDTGSTPDRLPSSIHEFLQLALGLDDYAARLCWTALRELAWNGPDPMPRDWGSFIPVFLEYGACVGIHIYEFFPPMRQCIHPQCPNNARQRAAGHAPNLGELITIQATLFTRAHGPIPISTTSAYCRGCSTRYYYNAFVQHNIRTYYDSNDTGFPFAIQLSTHFFLETELCERFATQMGMAWTSAQNCARIYNAEGSSRPWRSMLPMGWPVTFDLDGETVSEAFVMHALLDWHHRTHVPLQVPHRSPTQAARWHDAVHQRNMAMAGTGQPAWNHACDLCVKHLTDGQGQITGAIRSVVTDGVSLGHPCCGVRDCKEGLVSSKDRFCETHMKRDLECVVERCRAHADAGFRTCVNPSHRVAESRFLEKGKAMFELKRRLARSSAPPGPDRPGGTGAALGPPEDSTVDELDVDEEGNVLPSCEEKPEGGVRKAFARFGRRRTHNEELCVASCGVILGRATFYGAEGPNSVRVFWKNLFPTKQSLPSVMWYDNNCHVSSMIEGENDTYFEHVALPVDVFHFKAKHKESHGYCGRNCNPARWPELINEETGGWTFNSSAAEQVNLWFGGYHSITRLMREDRYNFFLDEMIMRRNRQVIARLEETGHGPYLIPREELLGGPCGSGAA